MKRALVLAGALLAILGFYAPWMTTSRHLAALTYNALDLTEFTKFVIRAGLGSITRELFLVPIVAAALVLALWAGQPQLAGRLARYALACFAAIFTLVPLPPYPFLLTAYSSAEDRGPLWLSLVGLVGVALVFVSSRVLGGRRRGILYLLFALIGAVPAMYEFAARAAPAISAVYGLPVVAGWGLFVMGIGFALVTAGGIAYCVTDDA